MMTIITTISATARNSGSTAAVASAATSSNCFNLSNRHFYPEVSTSKSTSTSTSDSNSILTRTATTASATTANTITKTTSSTIVSNSHQIRLPSLPFRQSSNSSSFNNSKNKNKSNRNSKQQQQQFYSKHFPLSFGVGGGGVGGGAGNRNSLSNEPRQLPHNPNYHSMRDSGSVSSQSQNPQHHSHHHHQHRSQQSNRNSYRIGSSSSKPPPSSSSMMMMNHHRHLSGPSSSSTSYHHPSSSSLSYSSFSGSHHHNPHPSHSQHHHHSGSHNHSNSNHHPSHAHSQHHHHHNPNSNHHSSFHHQHPYNHSYHHPQSLEDYNSFISPCVKYSLFFFNLVFWIIGASLMSIGCWSLLEEYDEYNLLKFRNIFEFLLHISLSLMLAGFVIFAMSFTGCLGALRENLCLIKLYSLMLLLLFVAEVIISSLAFIFPNTLSHFLKDRLSKDLITKYRDDTNLQNLIDIVQMEFKCCGVSDNGFKDWSKNIYFNCNGSNPSSERCAVPFSCCRNSNTGLINIMCGYNMQNLSSVVEVNKYVYTRGCVEAMSELVERNMNLVAGICLGSALAQLFAMFLARSLQGQIFAQRARWM